MHTKFLLVPGSLLKLNWCLFEVIYQLYRAVTMNITIKDYYMRRCGDMNNNFDCLQLKRIIDGLHRMNFCFVSCTWPFSFNRSESAML